MKLDIKGDRMEVTLSKRNLLGLLTKLDHDWSAKELESINVYVDGELDTSITLSVKAESDEDHYTGRDAGPPGLLHPQTEEDIRRL